MGSMKIRVEFNVELSADDRALVILAKESQASKIRSWVKSEAEWLLIDRLENAGVTILGADG